jgi:hypothetical protein
VIANVSTRAKDRLHGSQIIGGTLLFHAAAYHLNGGKSRLEIEGGGKWLSPNTAISRPILRHVFG